jgi:predicted metal-dependent enzyme (double-stranded beta helix superfamily)
MKTMNPDYTLAQFVTDLKLISATYADTHTLLKEVKPLAVRLAASDDLYRKMNKQTDEEQGFGFQILHEEVDHTLAVALLSWLPGRGTPAHDHGTWGVVVGVEGDELNTFWKRVDDGSQPGHAELEKLSEKIFKPGEAIGLLPSIIHSVHNPSDQISVSLHVYGKNVNHTSRSRFDPEKRTVELWTVKQN